MQVSLLSGVLDNYASAELYILVNRQFATGIPLIPLFAFERMLKHYKDYRRDGMTVAWIVNEMKAKRAQVADGAYVPSDMQIAAFVAGLSRLEKNDIPGDPYESPSWAEAYGAGLGKIPWGTLALAAAGLVLAYGFATGVGKGLISK